MFGSITVMILFFFFSSRRRHTSSLRDWSSDVCSSDLASGSPWLSLPWSYVGLPAATVPAGAVGGLPVGLQLVAGWHADEELLAWAADIAGKVGHLTIPSARQEAQPQSFTWY